jgi:hypothetical protein
MKALELVLELGVALPVGLALRAARSGLDVIEGAVDLVERAHWWFAKPDAEFLHVDDDELELELARFMRDAESACG